MTQSTSATRRTPLKPWLALVAITVLVAWLDAHLGMPTPRATNVPSEDFSAIRATAETHALLPREEPHPVGSPANHAVRDRIIARFQQLGYSTQINSGDVCSPITRVSSCAFVENIIATPLAAPTESASINPGILLSAHYDSVSKGPGIADDLVNVGALLEIARALKADPPLPRRVSFLITDGEEPGLIGAELFRRTLLNPASILAVLNLEARGTSGHSMMFETSPNNAALVHAYAKAAPYSTAASYFTTLYEQLPNNTDFTVFKRAGVAGLNFAFIEDAKNYHTPHDDFAHLDPRSVQAQGADVLAVTRYLATSREPVQASHNSIFVDILHLFVLRWPAFLLWPLVAILWAGWLLGTWRAARPRESVAQSEAQTAPNSTRSRWFGISFLRALGSLIYLAILTPLTWAALILGVKHWEPTALHNNEPWISALLGVAAFLVLISCDWLLTRHASRSKTLLLLALIDLSLLTAASATLPGLTSMLLLHTAAAIVALCFAARVGWVSGLALYSIAAIVLIPALHNALVGAGLSMAVVVSPLCVLLLANALPVFADEN